MIAVAACESTAGDAEISLSREIRRPAVAIKPSRAITTAVVAGMGGSSLAPDVLYRTFGTSEGYLELRVLDSTDPEAVAAVLDDLDPLRTLFIIATKSGTTVEPNAFLADAWKRVEEALERVHHHVYDRPGDAFIAITDFHLK